MVFFITIGEIIDIVIMAFFIGFLFKDIVAPANIQKKKVDVLDQYGYSIQKKKSFFKKFFDENFWFSVAVLSPAIILHELSHKFVAMGFGLAATFHAFYANSTTLFLGVLAVLSKLANFGFLFIVPGFVSIAPGGTYGEQSLIAFAGPAIHLIFWIGSMLILRYSKDLSKKWRVALILNKKINMFLFILNMLPIPGIDGWHVFSNLFKVLF